MWSEKKVTLSAVDRRVRQLGRGRRIQHLSRPGLHFVQYADYPHGFDGRCFEAFARTVRGDIIHARAVGATGYGISRRLFQEVCIAKVQTVYRAVRPAAHQDEATGMRCGRRIVVRGEVREHGPICSAQRAESVLYPQRLIEDVVRGGFLCRGAAADAGDEEGKDGSETDREVHLSEYWTALKIIKVTRLYTIDIPTVFAGIFSARACFSRP